MAGFDSTHSRALSSNSSAGTTSSTTPAVLAFLGSFSLPSSSSGAAAIAPSLRASRVVPPAPGKMPTMISGRPILALGLSAAKIRWQASGISRPMPSAVPGRAAAIGLPPLFLSSIPPRSILRRMECMFISPSIRPCSGLSPAISFILAITFRSIPPAKEPSFPLVITIPLTASSASASSTRPSRTGHASIDITFIDLPGTSQVMTATPSAPFSIVKSVMSQSPVGAVLHALDNRGGTHAGGDAKRGKANLFVGPLKLVQQRAYDDRAGGTQRVAHGDRAAVDVDYTRVDIKGLHESQDDGGKRLVHLEQVDVRNRHAAVFEGLVRGWNRTGQHDRGVSTDLGGLADTGPGGKPPFFAKLLAANQHTGGAIDDARGVPGVVDMVDLFKMRVLQLGHGIEARHHLAHLLEAGVETAKRLHAGARAHVFVVVQNGQAVLVPHFDDRLGKALVFPRGSGALLAFHRQGIGVIAAEAIFGGDDIGRDTLRDEIGLHRHTWVHGNRRAVAAHGHTAHHLDPSGDIGLTGAAHHLVGGKVHRFHARGAETVDRQAGDRLVKIRGQYGCAGKAAALLHYLRDVAPDHVFDGVALKPVAVFQGVQHLGRQPNGGDLVQGAVLTALAAWRAHCVVDISVGHHDLLGSGPVAGEPGIRS